MQKFIAVFVILASTLGAAAARAAVVLDFENIAPTYPFASNSVLALDYYNGGTSSAGTSGPDYGAEVSGNGLVLCLNTLTVICPAPQSNASRGGLAPGSDKAALLFTSNSDPYINVAAGFNTGFAFNYASVAQSGSAQVYSGLNGTGTLLASIPLVPNAGACPGYVGVYCPFSGAGTSFLGVAQSVFFAGAANQIVFDDITFGSAIPGVPEPTTNVMMLAGLLLLGSLAVSRRGGD